MQIRVQPWKMKQLGQSLLETSRKMRRDRQSVEEVQRALRTLSGMEEIRYRLTEQIEQTEKETLGLVKLSTALNEAAALYEKTDNKNVQRLEAANRSTSMAARTFGSSNRLAGTLQRLLRR